MNAKHANRLAIALATGAMFAMQPPTSDRGTPTADATVSGAPPRPPAASAAALQPVPAAPRVPRPAPHRLLPHPTPGSELAAAPDKPVVAPAAIVPVAATARDAPPATQRTRVFATPPALPTPAPLRLP
ncbi:MAG: hypothetical protein AB7P21_06500 [Lautropia sp.]